MSTDGAKTTVRGWRLRLARWLIRDGRGRFSERRCCYDIVDRLELDIRGPAVHVDYYRQDCADALAEIVRLRRLVHALAIGKLEPVQTGKGEWIDIIHAG